MMRGVIRLVLVSAGFFGISYGISSAVNKPREKTKATFAEEIQKKPELMRPIVREVSGIVERVPNINERKTLKDVIKDLKRKC